MANEAQTTAIVETNDPARALAAAVSWLAGRPQRRDLVVLSDFQRGLLDSNDVRAIPADISLTFRRIPVVSTTVVETRWTAGDRRIVVRATPRGDVTDADWATTKEDGRGSAVTLLGAEGDRAAQKLQDPGIRHLAILVENFDAAYAKLKGLNVSFLAEPFENQGNRLVFFTDVDGNYLHLIQRQKSL